MKATRPAAVKTVKLKSLDIELAVASYLNPRQNLIVPNVHWGLFMHECDLLVVTKAGYCWEVEIKISKADLVRDKDKKHNHFDHRIKDLYFAMPDYLAEFADDHVPPRAGIILVDQRKICRTVRRPKSSNSPYKFSTLEKYQVARLGALRIWGLKRKIRAAVLDQ